MHLELSSVEGCMVDSAPFLIVEKQNPQCLLVILKKKKNWEIAIYVNVKR